MRFPTRGVFRIVKLAWCTDIHLNFLGPDERIQAFAQSVADAKPDAVLITGDIGEAPTFERYLRWMQERVKRAIYFVLGNHDIYWGRFESVHERARALTERTAHLRWLPAAGVVELTAETALAGVDGWADGRLGRGAETPVGMSDKKLIENFVTLSQERYFERIAAIADAEAARAKTLLGDAFGRRRRVILATHVPPFREAVQHEGRVAAEEGLPHYASRVMGETLLEVMRARPDGELLVLCGHTHAAAEIRPLPNLRVVVGASEYRAPALQALQIA